MNVAFIIYKAGKGGAERVSITLAEYLMHKGHKVGILCYRDDGTYPVAPGIEVSCLPDSSNFIFRHIRRFKAYKNYCKSRNIQITVALHRGYDYTWLYRKLLRGKLILSQRIDPKAEYRGKPWLLFQCLTFFRGADAVVFQTQEEMDFFPDSIKEKGTVISNPVRQDLPVPCEGKRRKIIVNFCRLEPQKNLMLLIDASAGLGEAGKEFELRIYGNGPLREALKKKAADRGISERVKIIPFSSRIHEEIRDMYMFVSSSDFEGISNSMLEAMAVGLPCICTDCPAGGARLAICDGENGLLVPTGDQKALTEAMLRLIRNPEDAERMGRNAVGVRQKFSPERICGQWEQLMKHIM